jgi:hypothetical protein
MANINQPDRRDRKFAEVIPPQLPPLTSRDGSAASGPWAA